MKALLISAALILGQSDPVEPEGVPSSLAKADTEISSGNYSNIDSMVVYHRGELVTDRYYGRFNETTLHRTHSTFKSITGLLALIAIDRGLISSDELVEPLLATFAKSNNADSRRGRITVQHLMDMTSGLACDEAPGSEGPNHEWGVDEGPTPLQYSLDIPMAREPGAEWHYCSANSFMLAATISAALKRAQQPDIFKFADEVLFRPLKISNYRLTRSQSGKFLNGQGNSYFTPKDLAQLGLLVLNKGELAGKRILSESAVAGLLASNHTINWLWTDEVDGHPRLASAYASQWYRTDFSISEKAISAWHSWGNGGQFIFVVPELELVVVFTGSNQGSHRIKAQKQPFDIMWRYVLPTFLEEGALAR